MRLPPLALALTIVPAAAQGPSAGRVLWVNGTVGAQQRMGNQVEAWADSSGTGNELVQADGSRMPTFEPIGLGGHPTLVFDGNDSLARTNGMPTGSYSKVMVCAVDDLSATNNVLSGSSQHAAYFAGADRARIFHSGTFVTSGVPVLAGELVVLVATYDAPGQTGLLYQNGVLVGSGSAPPHADTAIEVGSFASGNFFIGRISELMVYDHVLDAGERAAVETYLFSKYLTNTPPEVGFDHIPKSGQVLQRDAQGQASLRVEGMVVTAGFDRIEVEVLRDDLAWQTVDQPLAYGASGANFALAATIDAGFHDYEVSVRLYAGPIDTPVAFRQRIACGDTLLIQGQSNAVAGDFHNEGLANAGQSPWIRSFGSRLDAPDTALDQGWDEADGEVFNGHAGIGQWGLTLAQDIVASQGVPVGIVNGAVGGTSSSEHQRDDANPENLATIYGRFLWRARRAEVATTARALLWYQGESDNGNEALHAQNFDALYDDWHADFPALEKLYVFQVRTGCGVSGRGVREVQRNLSHVYPDLDVMSTTAAPTHDGCHYRNAGYTELGERIARLVRRDLYGSTDTQDIDAPDVLQAEWVDATRDRIRLTFRDPGDTLVWGTGSQAFFQIDGSQTVASGSALANTVLLDLSGTSTATSVSYVGHSGDGAWVTNARGVGALAFFDVPIVECSEPPPAPYCVTSPNAVGPGARILAAGSQSIALNLFTLEIGAATPNQFGLCFYGTGTTQVPAGNGVLCIDLSGGLHRLPVVQSDALGNAFFQLDFGAPPMDAGAGQVVAGTTYNFQYWYRDPGGPGGTDYNFSDGLAVAFCP
ncbi:MAG: hypothetical protein GY711_07485 [bacterium]|nr:hypothetical protein [bacterium]